MYQKGPLPSWIMSEPRESTYLADSLANRSPLALTPNWAAVVSLEASATAAANSGSTVVAQMEVKKLSKVSAPTA